MKILSRVSLFVLGAAFSLFLTTGYVQAAEDDKSEKALSLDEVKALIEGLSTYGDATAGVVPEETGLSFYDIYARQIAYRDNTKAFRASLEARREKYKDIYIDKRNASKDVMEKVYKAEIAAYQKELASQGEVSKEEGVKEAKSGMSETEEPNEELEDTSGEVEEADSEGALIEEAIPPKNGEEEKVKKKVVTSDDAPDFDPSDLSDEEDDEWSDEAAGQSVADEEPMAGDEQTNVPDESDVRDEEVVEGDVSVAEPVE